MSAEADVQADEPTEAQEPRPGRGEWIQDWQAQFTRHVFSMGKAGVFKEHPSYQMVLMYYLFNLAIFSSEPRGFRRRYVMPGCTYPAAVAKATSLTPKTVRLANVWLHQHRIIEISDFGAAILALTLGKETEAERLELLAAEGLAAAPELRTGPRPKRRRAPAESDESALDVQSPEVIEPQVRSIETSGSITEGRDRTSGSTYSSDLSSSYNSDHDSAEARGSAPILSEQALSEEEEAPAGPEEAAQRRDPLDYIMNLGNDRPSLPDDGLHWFVDISRQAGPVGYRPATGRSRPKPGEKLFQGSEHDLLQEYPSLAADTEPGSRDDAQPAERRTAAQYCNDYWVQTKGKYRGYFTKTDSRSSRDGEVQISLAPGEAAKFWKLSQDERVRYMRTKAVA